ncbi:MAG: undecaprenyl/decaprenyl-phosphate alpha-N-acetylglucosaminyl 1-phosphate transferase [Candidatus Dormibacteraeota bacterium]|nr:undecaprenyl/decaprenyl-phosphate alpha-N-acetylglucosaminyl 1-phosphate transferase [Candidatus Dormibacteraeota bacterium]
MIADSTPWLPALAPFIVASIVCMCAVPVSIWFARRTRAVAEPDADRHLHPTPTPRLGGIAMFIGFAVAIAIFGDAITFRWQLIAVCLAITVAMALDDIFDLSWRSKLAIEVGAGVLVAITGVVITFIAVPGLGSTQVWQLGWLAVPVTIVWVTGMQVSVNFLDGADGVAAGVVAIVAAVCLLAAINRLQGPGGVQGGVIIMSGALMGCCLGFLVFNLPPARVFMGDSGSHFLGVALSFLTVLGVAKIVVGLSLLVPIIALGLPISDTAFAIVRRRRAGKSPAEPDAGHLHHRLLARGMTPLETALTFYLATGILGCIALSIYGHRKILDAALALLVLSLAGLVWRSRRRAPLPRVVVGDEDYVIVPGRRAAQSRLRHGGEAD